MINEEKIILGLAGALSGATVIIIMQNKELKKAKSETRRQEAVTGVFERALFRAFESMTGMQLLDAVANFEEEGQFQKIIRDL